jgi:hypothetical protein
MSKRHARPQLKGSSFWSPRNTPHEINNNNNNRSQAVEPSVTWWVVLALG